MTPKEPEKMKKLSEIMMDLSEQLLAQPVELTSSEGGHAALLLAQVGWNRAVDRVAAGTPLNYLNLLARFEKDNPKARADLKSYDCEELIEEIVQIKLEKYPFDDRFIHVCGTTPQGNLRVEWVHTKIKQ